MPAPGFAPMDPSPEGLGRVLLRVLKSGVAWQDRGCSLCHWPQRRLATWESAPRSVGSASRPAVPGTVPAPPGGQLRANFLFCCFPHSPRLFFHFLFLIPFFLMSILSPCVCVKHLKARKLKPTGPPGRTCMGRKRGVVCPLCDCHGHPVCRPVAAATPLHPCPAWARPGPALSPRVHAWSALSSPPRSLSQLSSLASRPQPLSCVGSVCPSLGPCPASCLSQWLGSLPGPPHPMSLRMHSTDVLELGAPRATRGHSTPGCPGSWPLGCRVNAPSSCCHKRETGPGRRGGPRSVQSTGSLCLVCTGLSCLKGGKDWGC